MLNRSALPIIDVFKVGVHVGMTSNASQVLSVMLRELTGLHIAAGKLEKSLGAVRKAAIGAGAVFAGWKAIDGIWKAIEGNRELNRELEKTKQLGGDFAKNIGQTREQAIRTQNAAPTTVLSDNVRLARELGTQLNRPEAANEMLTEAAKTAYVVSHYTGEHTEDIIKNLVKVADARGQIYTVGKDGKEHVDPEKLKAELEAAARGLIVGGNFLRSGDFVQMVRQGGPAVKQQSPVAFYGEGAEGAIGMGASKFGTAETGLVQQFIGGTMTKKVAEHLTEAGLLKSNEWHSGKSGGVVVDPKVAGRFHEVLADPVAWLTTGAGGAAIKAYAEKNKIDVTSAVFQLFGRQTVQRLVNEAMSNEPQFARAREIYGQVPSVEAQYKELHDKDLDTNIIELSNAWKSFMQAFSDAGTPLAIDILHKLTSGVHLLMNACAERPEAAEWLIGLAGGIAALTALGGGLVILNTCWAPLAAGLRLLIAASSSGPAVAAGSAGASAAAGTAAGVGGASILRIGAKVLKFGGPVGAFVAGMWPGSAGSGQEDDFLKAHADRFTPPGQQSQPVQLQGNVVLDGKKVGSIVANGMADHMSKPAAGGNSPDGRVTPFMPGMLGIGGF